jgi:hypothetical protein
MRSSLPVLRAGVKVIDLVIQALRIYSCVSGCWAAFLALLRCRVLRQIMNGCRAHSCSQSEVGGIGRHEGGTAMRNKYASDLSASAVEQAAPAFGPFKIPAEERRQAMLHRWRSRFFGSWLGQPVNLC